MNEGRGRIGVLISGRGSNMIALADSCSAGGINAALAGVAVVISNEAGAAGLDAASKRGIETIVVERREGEPRGQHDARVVKALQERGVTLVCLAGYMRLLSPGFVREYQGRIMNIHPALLPSFPGLHAQKQAVDHGVRWSGATVHFVDAGLDSGPIILQSVVRVKDDDTGDSLAARILREEHRIYPEAVSLFFQKRLRIEGRRVRIAGR